MRSGPLRPWLPRGIGKTPARLAHVLLEEGPSTRARLGELTGLSRPTISTALAELDAHHLLEVDTEGDPEGSSVGRPAALVRLSRHACLAIGVDIGRRHIQIVLTDLGYQEIDKAPAETDAYRHPPSADAHPEEVLDKAAGLVQELLSRNGSHLNQVIAIGLGIPAPITRDGRLGSPTLLPDWAKVKPGMELSSRLSHVPVLVGNDADLGALGEYTFGGFRDPYHPASSYELIYVKVATGIGAGFIRDGQLYRGASGIAGELGHITLDYKDQETCRCGNHGCLELYAGGEALLNKARGTWPNLSDTLELVDQAKAGDPYCISVIKDAGDHIGVALGIVINLCGPSQIVIGGELSDSEDILLDPIRQKVSRSALSPSVDATSISKSRLKKWSSAWGAAALALKANAVDAARLSKGYSS